MDSVTGNVAINGVLQAASERNAQMNQLFPHRHWSLKNFNCAKCGAVFDSETPIVRQSNQYLCWPCHAVVYGNDSDKVGYHCQVCNRVVYALPHRFTGVCSHRCQKTLTARRNRLKTRIQAPVKDCPICGRAIPLTTGRSDKAHCSPACRQKAYRQRQQGAVQ